jgi:phosphoserine phosphatase
MIIASDFDGTLSMAEMGRATGKYLTANGYGSAYRRFLYPHMLRYILAKTGLGSYLVFKNKWAEGMPALFEGFSEAKLREMFEWVVENELWPQRRQSVTDALIQFVKEGHDVVIVTGGYQPMVDAFAARIGATALGTALEMVNGQATGRLAEPLNIGERKVNRLQNYLNGRSLWRAYGDTIEDVPMLELAAQPVAVAPRSQLAAVAKERGWEIVPG